jgi:hypothetical protein
MALRFYNTLSQQVEEFSPARDNTVRMYTCGPTVYDFAHIGNFRTFTFVDILRKWLRASGFRLDHVMNITDVDDKIIRNAVAQHKTLAGIHRRSIPRPFLEDCATLRLERPERLVPATEHIDDMVGAIERLGAGNHTYTSDGSVYFRIAPSPDTASSRTTISAATWRARAWTWTNTKRPTPAISRCGSAQGRRAVLGHRHRPGPPRLAHRVLRDGHQVPGRDAGYPRRRRRSDLPAPRKRDRAIGIAHRQTLRALLAARRVPHGGGPEDVQVAGQLLHAPRPAGRGTARSHPLPAGFGALPQERSTSPSTG